MTLTATGQSAHQFDLRSVKRSGIYPAVELNTLGQPVNCRAGQILQCVRADRRLDYLILPEKFEKNSARTDSVRHITSPSK